MTASSKYDQHHDATRHLADEIDHRLDELTARIGDKDVERARRALMALIEIGAASR